MTRVLLLSKSDALRCRVAYCIHAAGIELDVLASKRTSLNYSRYVRKFSTTRFPGDEIPTPDFITLVNAYIAANAIDCVLPGDVASLLLLANLELDIVGAACFPVSSSETIRQLNDKMWFNRFLREHGLPAPRSVLLSEREDVFGHGVSSLTFPLIVKPLDMQAGRGVVKTDTLDQLAEYVYGRGPDNQLPLIVQDYQPGLDGGCSVLAENGRILAWVQQVYAPDGTITYFQDDTLLAVVAKIVEFTDFTGVANFDMRFSTDLQLRSILECNPRFWYSLPAAMVHGINFVEAGIDLALGRLPADGWQAHYRTGWYLPFRAAVRRGVTGLLGAKYRMEAENLRELWRETVDFLPILYRFWSVYGVRK